jgi:simple sugar transport system ATP-binding protein
MIGFIQKKKVIEETQKKMNEYHVRLSNPQVLLFGFSGGNQQKFVIARELSKNPDFILCAHPTRGSRGQRRRSR